MSGSTDVQATGAEPGDRAGHESADEGLTGVDELQDLLGLVARPSKWKEVRLFASPARTAMVRRPTDIVLFVGAALTLLVVSMTIGATPKGFEAAMVQVQSDFPQFLAPVWQFFYDALAVWAVFLVLAAAVRRHWILLAHQILAGVLALLAGMVIGRLVNGSWPALGRIFSTSSSSAFPSLRIAIAVALASTASPHLSRPFRYLGRWLVGLAMLSGFLLAVTRPWGIPIGFALGVAIAAGIHLAFGSPGGRPTLRQVRLALADLGIDAEPIGEATMRGAGVAVVDARAADGTPLLLKVYGRDAWDGQLITTFWRFLWYRGTDVVFSLTRSQQVEHEAFLTLLAERRGAPVTPVAAAGRSNSGDAVLAVEVRGTRLTELDASTVDDDMLSSMWTALRDLHGSGVAHGRLDTDRILIDPSGQPRFADFGEAVVVNDVEPILGDRAQLLVTTALLVGSERAIRVATVAIEPDGVAEVIPFLQPAALSAALRDRIAETDFELDDLRKRAAAAANTEIPELARLRRITWGTVILGVILFIAGYFLVSSLADIGWSNIVDALQEASIPIAIVALVLAQVPRVTQSFSVMAISPIPLALGRVTALQFATTFINLAMPSTAARVAVDIRFFQRAGASPGTAVAVGALDGFAGFIVQVTLLATILLSGLGSVDLNLTSGSGSVNLAHVLILVGIIAAAVALVLALSKRLRDWLFKMLRDIWATVHKLRSPRAVVQLFAANLVTELLFSLAMWTVLLAFDQHVSYFDVVVINEAVALFAGLMPVPGGIGITEAALTACFVSVGVPDATAFAAALVYRMVSYYLPPIWGFFAFRWLQRRRYL